MKAISFNCTKMCYYRIGIEFEYLLATRSTGRVHSYDDLNATELTMAVIANGKYDEFLYNGVIKRGYWYLEGDERFSSTGELVQQLVKGIEIRTSPRASIDDAINLLRNTERDLSRKLSAIDMTLAISAFHPTIHEYVQTTPFNDWELAHRRQNAIAFNYIDISMLTYGPDINISFLAPIMKHERFVAAIHKLTYYAPEMIALTVNAPFYKGTRWIGLSKRTHTRANLRPACKGYLRNGASFNTQFVYDTRMPGEHGRIEFKAFDAIANVALLKACCALVLGIALDTKLPLPSPIVRPISDFQQVAVDPFAPNIASSVRDVLSAADNALRQHRLTHEADQLKILFSRLRRNRTPGHEALFRQQCCGDMVHYGGLFQHH